MGKMKVINLCSICTHRPHYYKSHEDCDYRRNFRTADDLIPERKLADKNAIDSVIACDGFEEDYD